MPKLGPNPQHRAASKGSMAWLSSGSSNAELVNNMRAQNLVRTPACYEAFLRVDRGDFIPAPHFRARVYHDGPFHEEEFHMSAPHIYAWVMEQLRLDRMRSDPDASFLNVGSGTGYLSFLVAAAMGAPHLNVGVERVGSLVEFAASRARVVPALADLNFVRFVHADAFSLDTAHPAQRFSRMYVGGGATTDAVEQLRNLLKEGGIMVAPRDEELVRVTRDASAPGGFLTEIITSVRFAPLVDDPLQMAHLTPTIQPADPDVATFAAFQSVGGGSVSRAAW